PPHTVPSGEVLAGLDGSEPAAGAHRLAYLGALVRGMFHHEGTAGAQGAGSGGDDGAGKVESVRAAPVERRGGIVLTHLGVHGDAPGWDVGRVADHHLRAGLPWL